MLSTLGSFARSLMDRRHSMDLRTFPISARLATALLVPAAIVALAPALAAQSEDDDTYMGENTDRYASVRVLEGEATVRKGDEDESLSRGVPISEGDVVESHGRGVLQLADGSRVAFGPGTTFQIAALFADKGRDRQVLLRLDRGRLRIAVGRDSEALIRVDTPSGSASLLDGASGSFEVESDRTVRVRVHTGRLTFYNERDKASLIAGERLTVYGDQDRLDRIRNFNTYSSDAFDGWCERQLAVRRGPSWDRVPPEIRYYSDDLDEHGEWVYVAEYRTWCWRPLRVSAEWRPYWRGRWGAYPGGMTWISDEPWGYVTYHHGRWGWTTGLGWYWIPGVFFAPAWVAWHSSDLYFGWAPMGYHNRPATWGYGSWNGGYCWNVVEINYINVQHIHSHTHQEPGVIRTFNAGSGSTNWSSGPSGNRPLTSAWRQTPLVVNANEFRNPSQVQRVLQDPNTSRERLRTYEQQGNRTIYRRPLTDSRSPAPSGGTSVPPIPFEDRTRLNTERPIIRTEPSRPSATPGGSPNPNRPLSRPVVVPPPPSEQPSAGRSQPPSSQPRGNSGTGRSQTTTPPPPSVQPVLPPPPIIKRRPVGRP